MSGRAEALRPWPRMMRAETAAAYCGVSIDQLPPGFEIRPGEPRWLRDDFDDAWENEEAKRRRVYFIQAETTKLVKIGVANVVADRLYDLQAASPDRLSVIASVDGDMTLEKAFHRVLKIHRAHGEWFKPGAWVEVVLDAVAAKTYSWAILNELEAIQS